MDFGGERGASGRTAGGVAGVRKEVRETTSEKSSDTAVPKSFMQWSI